MPSFQLPYTTVLDTSGKPVVDGTVRFFIAGTSTPTPVYSNAALSVSLGSQVSTDASGRVRPIWMDPDILYDVFVYNSSSVLVRSDANVEPLLLSNSGLTTRIKQIASNPLDYGAIGDGVANEAAAVQSAVDNASSTVDLLGLTYRCDSTITIPANRRIINGTLNFGSLVAPNTPGISITGGAIAVGVSLTANATYGSRSATITSTTGFSVGDYVVISSSANYGAGAVCAETVRIGAIPSGTQLDFDSALMATYATAASAQVRRLTLVQNVSFESVNLIGSNTAGHDAVVADFTIGMRAADVRIRNFAGVGFLVSRAVSPYLSQIDCRDMSGTTGIGIQFTTVSTLGTADSCLFTDCDADGIRIAGADLCTSITLKNNKYQACDRAFALLAGAVNVKVDGFDISGPPSGSAGTLIQSTLADVSHGTIRGVDGTQISLLPARSAVATNAGTGATDAPTLRIHDVAIASAGGANVAISYSDSSCTVPVNGVDISKIRITGGKGIAAACSLAATENFIIEDLQGNIVSEPITMVSSGSAGAFNSIAMTNIQVTNGFDNQILVHASGALGISRAVISQIEVGTASAANVIDIKNVANLIIDEADLFGGTNSIKLSWMTGAASGYSNISLNAIHTNNSTNSIVSCETNGPALENITIYDATCTSGAAPNNGFAFLADGGGTFSRVTIDKVEVPLAAANGVKFTHTGNFAASLSRLEVLNSVLISTGASIYIEGVPAGSQVIEDIKIVNNRLQSTNGSVLFIDPILSSSAAQVTFKDNNILGTGDDAVFIINPFSFVCEGNDFKSSVAGTLIHLIPEISTSAIYLRKNVGGVTASGAFGVFMPVAVDGITVRDVQVEDNLFALQADATGAFAVEVTSSSTNVVLSGLHMKGNAWLGGEPTFTGTFGVVLHTTGANALVDNVHYATNRHRSCAVGFAITGSTGVHQLGFAANNLFTTCTIGATNGTSGATVNRWFVGANNFNACTTDVAGISAGAFDSASTFTAANLPNWTDP